MAKVPAGVGPRFPQVVVLVGATGDLARRKLIPGLLHLARAGFIPGCRIIGVSLDQLDADSFRNFAREAVNEFSARKVADNEWAAFAGQSGLRVAGRGSRRAGRSGSTSREFDRR